MQLLTVDVPYVRWQWPCASDTHSKDRIHNSNNMCLISLNEPCHRHIGPLSNCNKLYVHVCVLETAKHRFGLFFALPNSLSFFVMNKMFKPSLLLV